MIRISVNSKLHKCNISFFLTVDEYTKKGKRKTQSVAFENVNDNLGEQIPVDNIPSLVPATMPSNLQGKFFLPLTFYGKDLKRYNVHFK